MIVGSIIGRHRFTNQLYAIHRNQKTYLMFRKDFKQWFALPNNDFTQNVIMNTDLSSWKSLEGDQEQIFSLGSHQWMGNV